MDDMEKMINNMANGGYIDKEAEEVEVWTALEEAKYRYKMICELNDVFSSYSSLIDTGSSSGKLERANEVDEDVEEFFDDLDTFECDISNELQHLSGDTSKWVSKLEKAIEVLEVNNYGESTEGGWNNIVVS